MIDTYYTYLHFRLTDGAPFYVGKGKASTKRAHYKVGRNERWNRTVEKHGLKVEILSHWATDKEACEHEKLIISCLRSLGHDLVNMTDGGDGMSGFVPSEETRAKRSVAMKGRKFTAEHRAKIIAAQKGREFSDEHRAKLAAAQMGKRQSETTKQKRSSAMKAAWSDPAIKAAMCAARKKDK